MKKLSFMLCLFVLAALSGCATRRVVVVETQRPASPEAGNQGQAVSSQKHVDNGLRQLNKGHYKQAAEQFQMAIDADPQNWEAHYYLGLTFQRWKRYHESEKYFRLAINLNSRDNAWVSKVRVYLGVTLEHEGDYDKAEREYQLAMSLDPGNHEASERWEGISKKHKSKEKEPKEHQEHDD